MTHLNLKKRIFDFNLIFDRSGVLFIEDTKTLLVSDLHFGKSISMNKNGNLIPPYDNMETIINLKKMISYYKPNQVISLGDTFHENSSVQTMEKNFLNEIKRMTQKIKFVWIIGNHDNNLINNKNVGGNFLENLSQDNLFFTHIKTKNLNKKYFEFSGHYHPKTFLKINNSRYYYKCFVIGQNFCILPSFGYYTGGTDVKLSIFKEIKNQNIQLLILGKRKIIQQKYTL